MAFEKNVNADSAHNPSSLTDGNSKKPITLAHLSDPHISAMEGITTRDFLTKRVFGFLRWKLHRGAEHGDDVLSALHTDLNHIQPDHIAVTGDLTHLGLSAEYKKTRQWLQSLGSPVHITVIPGNHDAYVKTIWHQTMAHWTDFMISDSRSEAARKPEKDKDLFPILRTRGCVALIGVNTAHPSAPHLAVGTIGASQMQKLENILARTSGSGLYRALIIHHPPAPGIVSWRKRLTDAADLCSLLEQYGADLILHGHAHRILHYNLPKPSGKIPVFGAPSISALGRTLERRARYYLFRITPGSNGYNVALEVRIYALEKNRFIREREQSWSTNKMPKMSNE